MNRIYTAKYLASSNAPTLVGGALLVHAGRIAAIGTLGDLKRSHPNSEIVDFADALIVPLLVNAHTHLELTDYPLWATNAGETEPAKNFVDWILRLIRIKQKLNIDNYRDSLRNGIDQSIAAGTGAVGDILSQYALRNIYHHCTLIGSLYLETLGQDPDVICKIKKNLDEALKDEFIGSVELGISPHSPYTISQNYLQSLYYHCQQTKLRCATHLSESSDEVTFVEQSRGDLASRLYSQIGWENYIPQPSGLRPVEYLLQQNGLFPENLLVHGVQLNTIEIEILADKRMTVVLCPRSNAKLGVGVAPAGNLYRAGVKLALGTDSLASCDSLSIWDEMAFAQNCFNGELDAPTLFNLATQGGADALGVGEKIGSLEAGKIAAFQVLRPKTTVAVADVFDYFVSPTCTADIVQVYHYGRPQL